MTDFSRDMIPGDCDSLEKLSVWVAECFAYLYPETYCFEFLDENNEPYPRTVVECSSFYFTALKPGQYRHTYRHSIELSPDFRFGGQVHKYAKPLGNLAIPGRMKIGV